MPLADDAAAASANATPNRYLYICLLMMTDSFIRPKTPWEISRLGDAVNRLAGLNPLLHGLDLCNQRRAALALHELELDTIADLQSIQLRLVGDRKEHGHSRPIELRDGPMFQLNLAGGLVNGNHFPIYAIALLSLGLRVVGVIGIGRCGRDAERRNRKRDDQY